ncbi:MEP10 [Ectocarpus sp. CCAP 1310/34]|nr:MEP10 [Ectocarpus sp. CCAP 1310/34]
MTTRDSRFDPWVKDRCGDRGGGLTGADCCTSDILAAGIACGSAPCLLEGGSSPTPASSGSCDGILQGDVCCSAACGTCGGSGCGSRAGLTANECCTSTITAANVPCGSAPCVVVGDTSPTPTPPTPTTTTSGSFTCDGVLKGDYCCSAGCGECGGSGCSDRGGGLTGADCCTSDISNLCSDTGAAPCIVDGDTSPTPTPPTPTTTTSGSFTCDGVLKGDYCCSAGCGECGGSGCSDRGGGLTGADCCTSDISNLCSDTGAAPCIVDGDTSPTPTPPTPTTTTSGSFTCDGVLKGDYCCSAGCGECGGSGCSDRGGGLTGADCCTSDISNLCSDTGAAPCIVDDDSTGPTPTPPSPSPPTPSPPSPSTCSGTIASISTSSDSSSFSGGGCATLTDLYNTQSGSGPLYVLDSSNNIVSGGGGSASPTGYWLLTSSLEILDGVTLYVHGTSAGGDADVLRIQSTDDDFWEIRGWGGSLSFKETTVTSWDTDKGEERTKYEGGRSFINCVTQFDDSDIWSCSGRSNKERGECRMDIIDSTMGNMGWFDAESYGLTWKVRGLCTDLSNLEIMDDHNVYGDIKGSEIYGMYYGMYSYGHQGGVWTDNVMRDNILYGFDPHDDSDDLTIAGNTVYGNGNHGIIASKRCNNVEIYNNEVYNGDQAGIFLHRSTDDAKVYNNYVHDNGDAGIAIMESFRAEIYDNTIENCKYGIRLSLGSADNDIHDNTFDSSSTYGLYTYQGSDDPDVSGNDGRVKDNSFDANTISNTDVAMKIKEGDDNSFTNNIFVNVKTFEFEDSTDTVWTNNDIGGGCLDDSTDFASGSIPSC